MNKTITPEETELAKAILEGMEKDTIRFGQAVSVCSLFAEMKQLRLEFDEIVDGMNERFAGYYDRDYLKGVIEHTLENGIEFGLLIKNEETYSPTNNGVCFGNDWLYRIQNNCI